MAEVLTDIETLAQSVLEVNENVKDYLDTAVILEALGVTKETAKRYGHRDIFSLAKQVFEVIEYYRLKGETIGVKRRSRLESLMEGIKLFASGITLSSPWMIITLIYLLFKVSLLPTQVTPIAATSINLALVLSILFTAGLTPAFMRKILYFTHQQNYSAVRKVLTAYFIVGGVAVAPVSYVLMKALNLPAFYPDWWNVNFILFFVSFSLLWLSTAPLYALRAYGALVFTYLSSLATIGVIYNFMGDPSQETLVHLYGLLAGSLVAIIYLSTYIYLRSKFKLEEHRVVRVRFPFMIILGVPYSVVNLLYFIFIFTDRLVVWYTGGNPPFLVNLQYELPASLALIVLTVPFGFMNYYLHRLYNFMVEEGKMLRASMIEKYRQSLAKIYRKMQVAISVSGLASLAVLYFLLHGWLRGENEAFIFIHLGLGHVFLAHILSIILLCFYLHRPNLPIPILTLGVTLNLLLGFILTRTVELRFAAVSYLVSSSIVAVLAMLASLKLIRKAEYYYYSAF